MDIMIPNELSLVCIGVIIGAIAIARVKKLMITYALLIANFIVFIISYVYPLMTNSSQIVIRELGFKPNIINNICKKKLEKQEAI